MPYAYDEDAQLAGNDDDDDWLDIPTGFNMFPPGEEGLLQSHAGGEVVFHQMMNGIRPGRGDDRTRSNRIQTQIDAWNAQMDVLVDAYLEYQANGSLSVFQDDAWPLTVIGFEESTVQLFSHPPNAQRTNATLLRYGYIGASPDKPAIAFELRTLEIYRQIHRVTPRFTIDSLAKTLVYLHHVPRKSYLAEQLSSAYDAYLAILRNVDARVQTALGRDEKWMSKNICPPCFYKLKDEVKLKLSWLGCIDGNSSLKLVDSTFRAGNPRFDNRKSTSFRWLTPAQVDLYQDEVKNAPKISMATAASFTAVTDALGQPPGLPSSSTAPLSSPAPLPSMSGTSTYQPDEDEDPLADPPVPDDTPDGDVTWLNINELADDDANELERCVNTCVERWKAAGPEARKKMFALFAVAGIFLSVCRHGHVLVMCDMIRSGEL
ncbi:hypothetical protein B0H17DRAFT_1159884 [Mycena rosella]|uniref:CxC1-like cysteine cluster associated with KDZ transposases domain-containing protein n=1 Tax=Mycena rosella TaxID=1033263 RepID=A0AAD7GEL7_MYCRO|nr:hypothetical protein B0H17DRAFT_1159884 [Mycena rosella]